MEIVLIIPTGLFTKYEEYADALIQQVNPHYITLVYAPTFLTASSGSDIPLAGRTNPLKLADRYGARVAPDTLMGRDFEQVYAPNTNLAENPITENLKVRVYWNSKNVENTLYQMNIQFPGNVAEVISFSSDLQKLINASYGIIDDKEVKLVRTPVKYGLGSSARYCVSYWGEVSDKTGR